jgi:hypothetical protein
MSITSPARISIHGLSTTLLFAILCSDCSSAIAQTQPSENRSKRFGPDACGPVDPSYIRIANQTGGQPMFLQPSEAAKAFHFVRESTRNNMGTVFWATNKFDGKAQIFEIPVDSVTQRITFSFSADTKGSKLTLTQPSGGTIVEATASTEITDLNCGRIVTLSTPEAGPWRAEVTGTGRFWLQAQAQSDIYFITAEFVRKGGRPAHEGLFKIAGQPLAGIPATLRVSLSAKEAKSTAFRLVSERADTIQEVRMHADSSDREFLEFLGTLELPKEPFRVAVAGRDTKGRAYQRFFPALFHAETVEVLPEHIVDELTAGTTTQVTFALRNVGASGTFKITATDAQRFVSQVIPQELTLGTGESASVRVQITVPAGAEPGIGDDVVVVATSSAGSATSNSSVVHFSVTTSSTVQSPR